MNPSKPFAAKGASSQAVHAGQVDLHGARPSAVPIYASTTFAAGSAADLDAVLGGGAGFVYSRFSNPTTASFENVIATLEGATDCVAFGSGMAALHGALLAAGIKSGDSVLCAQEIYGPSQALVTQILAPLGVQLQLVDITDHAAVRAALEIPQMRVLLFETVSNPLVKVADVTRLCEMARASGAVSVVDATFTPPPLMRVLDHHADFAMHSATKYFGGHGDATGGVVSVREESFAAKLRQAQKLCGAVLSPFEAFLLARGVKTLVLRLREQSRNAGQVAAWLRERNDISRVFYPGLESHPQHELAARLLKPLQGEALFGAMLSFEIKDAGREEVFRFMDALQLIEPVTTLGDVQSEVSYPAISSHRGWSAERLEQGGISPGVVRLSVGIEDVADIIADLEQALAKHALAR